MRRGYCLLVSGLLLILAGCSADSSASTSTNLNRSGDKPATAAGLLAAGTAMSPIAGARTVNATLSEYAVTLETESVPAGPVHLVIHNTGQRSHQLQIYPKDAAAGAEHAMQMGHSGAMPNAVAFLPLIPAGETAALDIMLPAGAWEVACHLMDAENGKGFDHYDKGMQTTLIVGP